MGKRFLKFYLFLFILSGCALFGFLLYSSITRVDRSAIKIEVLNGCGERGLARRITEYLREEGFDVVEFGNASEPYLKTVVIDRRSKEKKFAKIVADALGSPILLEDVDSSSIYDVVVILGKDHKRVLRIKERRGFVF